MMVAFVRMYKEGLLQGSREVQGNLGEFICVFESELGLESDELDECYSSFTIVGLLFNFMVLR